MTKPFFFIQNRPVGYDYDPLVIAEIGINHEGCLMTAFKMVDAAVRAGAEVIKHQTHIIEDEMSGAAKGIVPDNTDVSIFEVMERCALNEDDEMALKTYVESKGAIFISTPFSRAAADRLQRIGVSAYKIGSGECNNYPLLEHVASFGKPIILSTGMNDIASIGKAVDILRKHEVRYALLHCTNIYPTPEHLVRLGAISELENEFPEAVVGLSDHTIDNMACLGGAACGASILERHFTDSKERPGPDIICSMDEEECGELIRQSKRLAQMRGGKKGLVAEEQSTVDFAYASVVATQTISAGKHLTSENIWVKRPGNGDYLAKDYELLMGRVAARTIEEDSQIRKEDLQ